MSKSKKKKPNSKKKTKNRTKKNKDHHNNHVIGVISVPLTPDKKYFKVCGDSYIASSHLKWMKKQNVDILVIPYDTKNIKYYFDRIHALYLPSGGAFAGTQPEYYNVCKKLIQMIITANDNGYYFPVWGCCMGFQQMLIIADGKDDLNHLLNKFDSYENYMTNIHITPDGKKSKIINGLDKKTLHDITKRNSTLNNHMMGLSPTKLNKRHILSQFYNIVGTSKDRKGDEFIAIIESNHYPFYGVQWHPERNNEMNNLFKFFVKETKKNKKKVKPIRKKPMFTKKINCSNYSEGLYNRCNFYWHKKTSSHNKNLCSFAQLKKKDIDINGV